MVVPELEQIFKASCRFGLQHLREIAASEGPARGIAEPLALEYFENNLVFELGEREYRGLDLFLQYAAEFDSRPVLRPVLGKVQA